jgi:hypothetical protein
LSEDEKAHINKCRECAAYKKELTELFSAVKTMDTRDTLGLKVDPLLEDKIESRLFRENLSNKEPLRDKLARLLKFGFALGLSAILLFASVYHFYLRDGDYQDLLIINSSLRKVYNTAELKAYGPYINYALASQILRDKPDVHTVINLELAGKVIERAVKNSEIINTIYFVGGAVEYKKEKRGFLLNLADEISKPLYGRSLSLKALRGKYDKEKQEYYAKKDHLISSLAGVKDYKLREKLLYRAAVRSAAFEDYATARSLFLRCPNIASSEFNALWSAKRSGNVSGLPEEFEKLVSQGKGSVSGETVLLYRFFEADILERTGRKYESADMYSSIYEGGYPKQYGYSARFVDYYLEKYGLKTIKTYSNSGRKI